MSKRYVWVVEWKDRDGAWSAEVDSIYRLRRDALVRARWWRGQRPEWPLGNRLSFRVVRYNAEDIRG